MATSSCVPPQVLVFQEFNTVPSEITNPLRAHISGPHAYLIRHSQPTEQPLGALGLYSSGVSTAYAWPQLPVGAIVDPTYTKVFVDNAHLQYFSDLIGAGDVVAPIGASAPNQVRIADSLYGFKSNGVYPRFPALNDRDVQPGDLVRLRGAVSGVNYALETYVQGLAADLLPASVGTATSSPANGATQTKLGTVAQVAGVSNCNVLVADLTNYNSYLDGNINDTYTVTVTGSSVGGDIRTATLRVTSASGKDDVLSIQPGETTHFFNVGIRGLRLKFTCTGDASSSLSSDDLIVGQTWTVRAVDKYVAVVPTAAGSFGGPVNTSYIVTVTRGGLFASGLAPQVSVTTTTGSDVSGPTTVTALATSFPVGTAGVTVSLAAVTGTGLRLGDVFYIPVTAAAPGRYGTLVLGHSLPSQLLSASDLDLKLALQRNIQVDYRRIGFAPLQNWTQTPEALTLAPGLLAYDPSLTSGGIPVATPVTYGDLSVEYRAWRQELVGGVGTIATVGDLDAAILGPLTPDNPLKWGVYSALLGSNGTDVKYSAVSDPTVLTNWADVLSLLVGRQDIYNLVPLTADPAVQTLYAAQCDDQSNPEAGDWCAAFFQLSTVTQKPLVAQSVNSSGLPVLATLAADPAAPTTAYTILSAPTGTVDYVAAGVKPGDTVRYLFATSWGVSTWQEFPIAAVISGDQLRLAYGPAAAVTVGQLVEVWHPLTKDEQATAIGAAAGAFADRRVKAVWPDVIGSGGTQMPGYFLCCTLAGLRSGVAPHQGLTNFPITGYDDVSRSTNYFNASQLNTMAGSGVWVVTQTPTGTVLTRDAITTDTTDIDHSQEGITSNLDSISYLVQGRLAAFIGVTNVTPTAVAFIYTDLVSAFEFLKNEGFTQTLGSQLIDYSIESFGPHALLADRLVAVVKLTIPVAVKNIECHLVV